MPSAAASESKKIEGIPVIRDAFPHTIRLVTSARLRDSVLKALVDSRDELSELEEIESATSARLIAQHHGIEGIPAGQLIHGVRHEAFINASFAYAKPGELNRFNGPDRGAWYAALDVETCLAEVTFHMTGFLERAGDYNAVVDYAELHASLAGEYLDLRAAGDHPCLNPDPAIGYKLGNVLARAVLARGINGIIYPSVRHSGGTCFAVLWPHAVQSVAQGSVFRLTWSGTPVPAVEQVTR
ncbi:MAG TPA: RES family NAD+ phosphorylase [Rhizomicrobium sp.]|nr:RES family NAD+ phosphorylase [Rhizomicrobium sp.]